VKRQGPRSVTARERHWVEHSVAAYGLGLKMQQYLDQYGDEATDELRLLRGLQAGERGSEVGPEAARQLHSCFPVVDEFTKPASTSVREPLLSVNEEDGSPVNSASAAAALPGQTRPGDNLGLPSPMVVEPAKPAAQPAAALSTLSAEVGPRAPSAPTPVAAASAAAKDVVGASCTFYAWRA